MTFFKFLRNATNLLLLGLLLAGCMSSYGRWSSERRHRVVVTLPPNAPSIESDYADQMTMSHRHSRGHFHNGIDIPLPKGSPVIAVADGKITLRNNNPHFGLMLIVKHKNHETSYFHLHEAFVEVGDFVKRGQKIASVGDSGSTAGPVPHLHFFVRNSNLHNHWIGGVGKVVCFEPGREYEGTGELFMTYPVECAKRP